MFGVEPWYFCYRPPPCQDLAASYRKSGLAMHTASFVAKYEVVISKFLIPRRAWQTILAFSGSREVLQVLMIGPDFEWFVCANTGNVNTHTPVKLPWLWVVLCLRRFRNFNPLQSILPVKYRKTRFYYMGLKGYARDVGRCATWQSARGTRY